MRRRQQCAKASRPWRPKKRQEHQEVKQRTALVLLPGLLCDAALWTPQIEALADVADSTVADTARHDNVGALAAAVLDGAPARFALAALSMGGYVAFEVLRRAPERVTRVALFGTSARPDTPEQTRRRRLLVELGRSGLFRGVTPRLLPTLIHTDRLDDADLVRTVTEMAERVGRAAFERQQRAIMNRPDSRPGLAAVRVPALVAVGMQDALTPPALSAEIAAGIAGARFVPIGDCGHLSSLERPAAVSALLRAWLSNSG
jgi:pimeloyl-ACP methyl ester carboxylesterase